MIHWLSPLLALIREIGRDLAMSPLSQLRQRRALQHLDDHLLRDIGLSRREARLAATTWPVDDIQPPRDMLGRPGLSNRRISI